MKSELTDLRARIDALDDGIVVRLAERFTLTDRIGEIKRRTGSAVMDAERERAILARLPDDDLREIYRLVMSISRRRQSRSA